MGKYAKGILGAFTGKIGTVVGSTWRGISYMRSLATGRKGSPSDKQLAQQARFALVVSFLESMKDLLLIGYKGATQMTEQNSAVAHTLKNAVLGDYPSFSILYAQVQISRGSLQNATAPAAVAGAAGTITFTWTDNSGVGKAKGTDQAMLVAYCEELKQTLYLVSPLRSAGTGSLNAPAFSGKVVQTWISFQTEDGSKVATSIYTGPVTVVS